MVNLMHNVVVLRLIFCRDFGGSSSLTRSSYDLGRDTLSSRDTYSRRDDFMSGRDSSRDYLTTSRDSPRDYTSSR